MDDDGNQHIIDTQLSDFKIKGAATRHDAHVARAPKRDGYRDTCTICLEFISERAVAVPCNHLSFDFLCLVSWLQEQDTCPLCKSKVAKVEYDFRSVHDFKTYHVPVTVAPVSRPGGQYGHRVRSLPRRQPRSQTRPPPTQLAAGLDASLERRRNVYRNRLYSLRVGANRVSHYHDFTAADFGRSGELQSRARMFLRRELQVFTFLDRAPRGGNREFLVEYIVAILKSHESRGADGRAEELLKDFLGLDNTRQLLHELEAWLRSPYTELRAWDTHVQYADGGHRRNKAS